MTSIHWPSPNRYTQCLRCHSVLYSTHKKGDPPKQHYMYCRSNDCCTTSRIHEILLIMNVLTYLDKIPLWIFENTTLVPRQTAPVLLCISFPLFSEGFDQCVYQPKCWWSQNHLWRRYQCTAGIWTRFYGQCPRGKDISTCKWSISQYSLIGQSSRNTRVKTQCGSCEGVMHDFYLSFKTLQSLFSHAIWLSFNAAIMM